ncbi:MAG: homoserine O-succinyltransferase [Pseudomonadota bacterium]
MPIKIPQGLPAAGKLRDEGVMLMTDRDAVRQDIRPLRICLLNLMPTKQVTECQIARLIGATPLQIEMTLLTTKSYQAKNTPAAHLQDFYHHWADVQHRKFDGLIITGAPVEEIPFEDVTYWQEIQDILHWAQHHVVMIFTICWGAQAALYYWHKVPKHMLDAKALGIFDHQISQPQANLLRGLNDVFPMPVSRYTQVYTNEFPKDSDITILAQSPEVGLGLVHDATHRLTCVFNHLEYDADTLSQEYHRDQTRGVQTPIPENYFPENDPQNSPINRWRAPAHLLFANWINICYQWTPFDLDDRDVSKMIIPA